MKKNHNPLAEHYLVPATLFLLNICLAHVIYAFTAPAYSPVGRIALALAFVLMGGSLVHKKNFLLTASMLFYVLIAVAI